VRVPRTAADAARAAPWTPTTRRSRGHLHASSLGRRPSDWSGSTTAPGQTPSCGCVTGRGRG